MTKVILGANIAQVDAPSGIRYGGNMPERVFDMAPSDAKAVVKLGGAYASLSGTTRRATGWRCSNPDCNFGSFVRTCSRCGSECKRE